MNISLKSIYLISILVILCLVIGCQAPISVVSTEGVCETSTEVHLVGVNRSNVPQWKEVSMTQYWKSGGGEDGKALPGQILRDSSEDYRHSITFGKGKPCEQVIDGSAEVWKKWKDNKAKFLFILVNRRTFIEDAYGDKDPRRVCLPLEAGCWKGGKIKVVIDSASINVRSEMKFKPKCQCD